jgi:hypothetical protein
MKRTRKLIEFSKNCSTRRRTKQPFQARRNGERVPEHRWVTGPTLRRMLNISAVTLWRWRHDPRISFPAAKRVNGRMFFAWHEVAAWLDKQPNAP